MSNFPGFTPTQIGVLQTQLTHVAEYERFTSGLYAEICDCADLSLSPALRSLFQSASVEDHDHFRDMHICAERLNSHYPDACLIGPRGSEKIEISHSSARDMLTALLDAESRLIRIYREICSMTLEFDYRIFDLAYRNLNDNLLHQNTVSVFLEADLCQLYQP